MEYKGKSAQQITVASRQMECGGCYSQTNNAAHGHTPPLGQPCICRKLSESSETSPDTRLDIAYGDAAKPFVGSSAASPLRPSYSASPLTHPAPSPPQPLLSIQAAWRCPVGCSRGLPPPAKTGACCCRLLIQLLLSDPYACYCALPLFRAPRALCCCLCWLWSCRSHP